MNGASEEDFETKEEDFEIKKAPPKQKSWLYQHTVVLAWQFLRLKWILRRTYKKASREPLRENKVVFLEKNGDEISDNYSLIYEELKKDKRWDIHVHYLRFNSTRARHRIHKEKEFLEDAATAAFIVLNDSFDLQGIIKKRKGQKIMNTWHACGAFKRFGYATADKGFGGNTKQLQKYPLHPSSYDLVTVSSKEIEWAYVSAMGLEDCRQAVKGMGVSRTDVFFDDAFVKGAVDGFLKDHPSAMGKKVMLYAPTFRGFVREAYTPDAIDIGSFYERFHDEWVMVFKYHPFSKNRAHIEERYRDFAFDLTDVPIERLLPVADICISDYSSLIYEYSLFERPMIFFAYDLDEYFDFRGFFYDYEELSPGDVVKTNGELMESVGRVTGDGYDIKIVKDFKEKFMGGCDGKATERIMESFFGKACS